jgi:tetratricopeptide (TPR) repeat protein
MKNKFDSARRETLFVSPWKWWQRAWHCVGIWLNRAGACLAIAAAILMSFSGAAAAEQDRLPQYSGDGIVQGTVRDTAGKPVALAIVLLEEKGSSTKVETRTNEAGAFMLPAVHAGTYVVRAAKPGWRDATIGSLVLSLGERKHVDLVLQSVSETDGASSSSQPSVKASPGTMEFKDEPSFTVAGVTDWSNLGLHGSAASSKTSESLAKETSALKSSEPEAAPVGGSSKRYDTALSYTEKGDFAAARLEVRKALANTDDAEGHRLLGELDERLNEPLEAVKEYEHAARMDTTEQNYFEWGTELLLHKAAEPAVEVFTRGSSAHPKSARMRTGLGAALYARGSWEEAARSLCAASDSQPADPAPYLFLGKIAKTSPSPLPCSDEKLARFAQEQPGNALANFYYAISIWKREQGSEDPAGRKHAETLLEKAVAIDPKLDEAYLQLGIVHSARGDFEQAIRDYKKAIDVNPRLGEAHRELGMIYQRTGKKSKAEQEFATYKEIEKEEAAERERERRELRQFLIILKDRPAATQPR